MFNKKETDQILAAICIAVGSHRPARRYIDKLLKKDVVGFSKSHSLVPLKLSMLKNLFPTDAEFTIKVAKILGKYLDNPSIEDPIFPILSRFFSNTYTSVLKEGNITNLQSYILDDGAPTAKNAIIAYMALRGKVSMSLEIKSECLEWIFPGSIKLFSKLNFDEEERHVLKRLKDKWWNSKEKSSTVREILIHNQVSSISISNILEAVLLKDPSSIKEGLDLKILAYSKSLPLLADLHGLDLEALFSYTSVTKTEVHTIIDHCFSIAQSVDKATPKELDLLIIFSLAMNVISKEVKLLSEDSICRVTNPATTTPPKPEIVTVSLERSVVSSETNKEREYSMRIQSLYEEIAKLTRDKRSLENYILSLDEEEEEIENIIPSKDEVLAYLNSIKICFIGGHYTLLEKIRELFPSMIIINMKDNINVPIERIYRADIVIVFKSHMSHPAFYKVQSTLDGTGIPLRRIPPNVNMNILINNIYAQVSKALNLQQQK